MYVVALIMLIPFIHVFMSYHEFRAVCHYYIERCAINISHHLIYTYSALQLMLKPYISVYMGDKDRSNYCMIGLVYDNYEACKTTMKLPAGFCRSDYLFNVCQYVDDENTTLCKINYTKQFSFHFEKTDPSVHFILVELIVSGVGYKIDLKTDNYSYYVVGNFFGLSYFRYMANDKFGVGFIKDTDHLELKIIDRDINTHQFSLKCDEDGILLYKDKYVIIQKETSDYLTQNEQKEQQDKQDEQQDKQQEKQEKQEQKDEQQEKKDEEQKDEEQKDEVNSQSSSEKWMDDI